MYSTLFIHPNLNGPNRRNSSAIIRSNYTPSFTASRQQSPRRVEPLITCVDGGLAYVPAQVNIPSGLLENHNATDRDKAKAQLTDAKAQLTVALAEANEAKAQLTAALAEANEAKAQAVEPNISQISPIESQSVYNSSEPSDSGSNSDTSDISFKSFRLAEPSKKQGCSTQVSNSCEDLPLGEGSGKSLAKLASLLFQKRNQKNSSSSKTKKGPREGDFNRI